MPICVEPGCGTVVRKGRCQRHKREPPTWHAGNKRAERRRRAAVVAAWIAEQGHWCPGYGVPGHVSTDLTAAHVVAVANGGGDGPLTVLCRACNSSQGTR